MSGLAVNDAGQALAFDGAAWKPAPVAVNDAGEKLAFNGERWVPLGVEAAKAKGREDAGNKSDAVAQAFTHGATMGFGDEATAAVRAAAPGLSNWMMRGPSLQRDESIGGSPKPQTVSDAPTYDARYSEELARERAKAQRFQTDNPVTAGAANIAGNIATAALALPAGVTAAGPSLVGNMAKMGAVGAGMGGVQGFGEGEGGLEDRLGHAGIGAAFGAAGGAAAPALGAAGRKALESAPGRYVAEKIVSPVAQKLADLLEGQTAAKSLSAAAPDGTQGTQGFFGNVAESTRNVARGGAVDRLATALQRSKLSTDTVGRRMDQLGPESMLADVDPQFLREARRANTLPGETSSYAKNVLESRDRQAGSRLIGAFEGDQPPPSSYQLRGQGQAFDSNLRAVGADAYGAMDQAGLKQSPELRALYENPYVSQALDHVMSVEKNARIGRPDAQPSSPVEIMHKVKQAIWDMGFDQASARPGPNASYYRDLGTAFVDTLKKANPAIAKADSRYAQAASLPEFFDRGRAFLARGGSVPATESSAPALADLLMKADPQQVLAARSGATNAARETALEGTQPARALARRIDESGPVQGKLSELYGDRAGGIVRQAGNEKTFAETSNELLRGSKTADKLAEMLDTGNAGFKVSPGGIAPRFFERLADLPNLLMKPNEAVRNEIGRMTLTPNAQQNREILKLAEELIRNRRAGNPVRGALAASLGAEIGRN